MAKYEKRPGFMFRACIAWVILNAILLFTLAALVFVLGDNVDRWYAMIPLVLAVVVSEWIIMAETIAPIIKDWIQQVEYVDREDGDKPSWEKKRDVSRS